MNIFDLKHSQETGSVPILSDKSTNMLKSIGKPLEGYQVRENENVERFIFLGRHKTCR